jgi:hypothetical protein
MLCAIAQKLRNPSYLYTSSLSGIENDVIPTLSHKEIVSAMSHNAIIVKGRIKNVQIHSAIYLLSVDAGMSRVVATMRLLS